MLAKKYPSNRADSAPYNLLGKNLKNNITQASDVKESNTVARPSEPNALSVLKREIKKLYNWESILVVASMHTAATIPLGK